MGERLYMRLVPDFRESFDWKRANLRDGLARWARSGRQPPIRVDVQHKWRPFREGDPVPREMVEAFSEYISDVLSLGKYPIRDIATPVAPPAIKVGRSHRSIPDIWRGGWTGAFSFFARDQALPEEAYCRDEDDLLMAARMILRNYGEVHNRAVTGEAAIMFAEKTLARTQAEYAAHLARLWRVDENTVMFATTVEKGDTRRVGVVVTAPVTEDFYSRYREGGREDMDIEDVDLASESLFIFLCAVADNKEIDTRRSKASRAVASLRVGLTQFASMAPPLYKQAAELRIISLAGTPENGARAKSYSFREVGTKTRHSKALVLEFAPPDPERLGVAYPLAFAEYLAMKAVISLFQAVIEAQRRLTSD